jgi:ankyrin repeat protein
MTGFDSLRHAAASGDSEAVRRLIQDGAAIGEMDNAAVRWALRHQHANVVKLLLDAGADVSASTAEFLSIAAKNGDTDSLHLLLDNMKFPTVPNFLDVALFDAIKARKTEAVKILIEAGADPAAGDNQTVMLASSAGSPEILEMLQAHGADLCVLDSQPLFNAVVAEEAASVRLLLSARADPNARLGICLVMAISNGNTEILELLLSVGGKLANPDLVKHSADSDSIETLLLLDHYGYPFHPYADEIAKSAAGYSSFRVLKFILENSAVTQAARNDALVIAAGKPSDLVLDLLIQYGADAGADRSAALTAAIGASHFSHARKLLGANAQVPDLEAKSVLQVIDAGKWPLFVTFLQAGVSVAGVNLSGFLVTEMFRHVTPPHLLRDSVGNPLPKDTREARQKFILAQAKIAVRAIPEEKTETALWLTQFLTEFKATA